MSVGLYIHVPFCIRKCPYCDFYSVTLSDELVSVYTQAVIRNIRAYREQNSSLSFDTVYFGGGTPSLMPLSFFDGVLSELSGGLTDSPEITAELNPGTSDFDKLQSLRCVGINRLSVGIQSAVGTELSDLGRIHSFEEAKSAVSDAYRAGFENISADLMIGIKGQTKDSLISSVDALTALPLTHISSYMLKIEEGTEFFKKNIKKEVPDEDTAAELYLLSVSELEKKGYKQYEISNFSRPGFESRHNLRYWRCEEYIGIGPSAHSYYNGKRYSVPRDLSDFTASERQREDVTEEKPADFFEKAMLALRLSEGLDLKKYPREAPFVLKRAEKFKNTPLLEVNDRKINLTPEGFVVSNSLISELLIDF